MLSFSLPLMEYVNGNAQELSFRHHRVRKKHILYWKRLYRFVRFDELYNGTHLNVFPNYRESFFQ